jgi:hypothetical protein
MHRPLGANGSRREHTGLSLANERLSTETSWNSYRPMTAECGSSQKSIVTLAKIPTDLSLAPLLSLDWPYPTLRNWMSPGLLGTAGETQLVGFVSERVPAQSLSILLWRQSATVAIIRWAFVSSRD